MPQDTDYPTYRDIMEEVDFLRAMLDCRTCLFHRVSDRSVRERQPLPPHYTYSAMDADSKGDGMKTSDKFLLAAIILIAPHMPVSAAISIAVMFFGIGLLVRSEGE